MSDILGSLLSFFLVFLIYKFFNWAWNKFFHKDKK